MKIWVDADALPREIKEILVRTAQRLKIETRFVANKSVAVPLAPLVSFVRVAKGADVADSYILDASEPRDFCVTADIPLAAVLVQKGLVVIDPRGDLYTESTVGERLATRNLMASLREAGMELGGGPAPFDPRAKQRFAARLDSLLSKALRERPPL